MFISFEGGNGSGKSTQLSLLRSRLESIGARVITTREPGGTEVAEDIRKFLRDHESMDAMTELLLMFAARREHFIKLIEPKLKEGFIVISDRFYDSSIVFQGVLSKVDVCQIMRLKDMVLGEFEPSLTFLLDLDYRTANARMLRRGDAKDKYDLLHEDKFNEIRNAYKKLAQIMSYRFVVINSKRHEIDISEDIFDITIKKLKQYNKKI